MKKIIVSVVLTALVMSVFTGIAINRIQTEHTAELAGLKTTYENQIVDFKQQVHNYVVSDGTDLLYDRIDGTLNMVQKAKNRLAFEKEFENIINNY